MNPAGKLAMVKVGLGDALENVVFLRESLRQAILRDGEGSIDTLEQAYRDAKTVEDLIRDILQECASGDDGRTGTD
jgi:hypothetical protein